MQNKTQMRVTCAMGMSYPKNSPRVIFTTLKVALQRKQEVINNIHTFCNYPFFFHNTFSYRVLTNFILSSSYLLLLDRVLRLQYLGRTVVRPYVGMSSISLHAAA